MPGTAAPSGRERGGAGRRSGTWSASSDPHRALILLKGFDGAESMSFTPARRADDAAPSIGPIDGPDRADVVRAPHRRPDRPVRLSSTVQRLPGESEEAGRELPPQLPIAELTRSPAWFPLQVARNDVVQLVRLDEAAYRAASFLDQRILESNPPQASCAATALVQAAAELAPAAHYVFHIGHVGSTLLSRLIGEDPRFFSVREPALLRLCALRPRACPMPLAALLALLSRSWRPQQRAVIKATSFVSERADTLIDVTPGSRALLMYTPALTYLRSIFGGPNSRVESRTLAPSRLARLCRRLAPIRVPEPRSEGEGIAMSWLCEITSLCQAAQVFSARVHWLEFEQFLADPAAGLAGAFTALGASPDVRVIDAALTGPLMRQYSKAPDHAYDCALRRRVLESADREHGDEIRKGMRWLSGLAGGHRLIDKALAL